jgi:hypothetical protein
MKSAALPCLLSAAAGAAVSALFLQTSRPDVPATVFRKSQTVTSPSASAGMAPRSSTPGSLAPSAERTSPARPLSNEEITAAATDILNHPDPVAALSLFSNLLRDLSPENASAAWQAFASHQGPSPISYTALLAHQWGSVDGKGALQFLASEKSRDALQARYHALSSWASQSPQDAIAWFNENANGDRTKDGGKSKNPGLLLSGLVDGVARHDIDAATRLIASAEAPEWERSRLLASLASRQLALGTDQANAWVTGISDPELQKSARASLARTMASQNVESAATWAAAQASAPGGQDAVGSVARTWAARDPDKAIAWINTLPEGPARQEAWEDAMRSWTRKDPEASSQHLRSMPAGPSRDAAVSSLTRTIAREDPTAAIAWAQTIADPAARSETLLRTAQLWNTVDAPAASQWAASNLPADLQQRFTAEPIQSQRIEGSKAFRKLPGAARPGKRR